MVTLPSSRGWRSTSRVDLALEFRQFIQEKHAVVGQTDLPGPGDAAAADEAGIRDGVVRRPEGPGGQQGLARRQQAHDAVDLGGL